MIYDYIIIGAGPAGLSAAINLKKENPNLKLLLIDKNEVGRKILVSGNGRCNIAHEINNDIKYLNDYSYQKEVFSTKNINTFFDFIKNTLKLQLIKENNLYYPYSKKSENVLFSFTRCLKDYKVCVKKENLTNLIINRDNFLVTTSNSILTTKKLVLAVGGKAYFKDYSNSWLMKFLKKNGVKCTPLIPGLTGYHVNENIILLDGVRVNAKVMLKDIITNEVIFSEIGEVQFKKDGVSGIVIMNSSNTYQRYENKNNIRLLIDLNYDNNLIDDETLLINSINEKIIKHLYNNNLPINLKNLIFELNITKVYDFSYAQISLGGIEVSDITSGYELKKIKNMYCLGELLDIDGVCGGLNIMHAILSALIFSENEYKSTNN